MSATRCADPARRPWHRPTLADRVAEADHRTAPYTCPRCRGQARVTARPGDAEPIVTVDHRPPCPPRWPSR
jgi:hypothetical protein